MQELPHVMRLSIAAGGLPYELVIVPGYGGNSSDGAGDFRILGLRSSPVEGLNRPCESYSGDRRVVPVLEIGSSSSRGA